LLIRLGLRIGAGVAGLVWALVSLLVLLIPFGVLAALFYMVSPVLAVIPAVAGLLTWFVLMTGLQVLVQTYLYSYSILVYHDLTS
ncbi:MAG: hypothetical protein ABEJ66_01665, partial [Candidatus Nanohaloarchaea archaeon]